MDGFEQFGGYLVVVSVAVSQQIHEVDHFFHYVFVCAAIEFDEN